jgi:hypothetical protein
MSTMLVGDSLGMDGPLRRCALTLHAITAQDRAWVLQRLTGPRRSELERLLGELDTLGIAPDPRLARAALGNGAAARVAVPVVAAPLPLPAQAALMAQAMAGEPPRLVAHVLLSRDAALCQAVLALMDAPRRRAVQEQVDSLQSTNTDFKPPRKLSEALALEVERKIAPLREAQQVSAVPAQGGWRSSWRRLGKALS